MIWLRATFRRGSFPQAGFTLVEIIVAILLIGLLAYSVIPRYQNRSVFDVSAQAEQLASDIRYTQSLTAIGRVARGFPVTLRERADILPQAYAQALIITSS